MDAPNATSSDPTLAALSACSATLLTQAAAALAAGDKAASDRTFKLREHVEALAASWTEGTAFRPRARKEGV